MIVLQQSLYQGTNVTLE